MDAPVGTGFSYATTPKGYYLNDEKFALHVFQFIRKVRFPLRDTSMNLRYPFWVLKFECTQFDDVSGLDVSMAHSG